MYDILGSSGGAQMYAPLASVASRASNIKRGENPPYTLEDFFVAYPAFGPRRQEDPEIGDAMMVEYIVPREVMEMYLGLAHACVRETRWKNSWRIAMGWFMAHFLTLYLQSMVKADASAKQVVAAGQARGLVASKSAGDLSVSYDYSSVTQDLDGWAAWKLTPYGQQLAAMGRIVGKGGMYVW